MSFMTYVLFSDSLGAHYVGHTDNLPRRLREHREGRSTFTKRASDWRLVYQQTFASRTEAARLEKRIKKTGAPAFLRVLNATPGACHPQRSEG
ncbi:MAG TPA: GIY-YIG nuclease family protein [Kiritimatiellia bacterium]|nr:GIY-YIG nuclease family protein [Kiritimatiellia bacterium]